MDFRDLGFDESMWVALHDMLEYSEETDRPHPPSRAYVRDNKAMKATPADIIEYPDSYHFVVDMPGLKPDQIKVQMEDNNVLVVSGERRREKEKDKGVKYIRMERRHGKFLKKFALFENANRDKISAVYQDGVLTVIVEKLPPPEPKQPKTIEVKVGSPAAGSSGEGQVPLETQGQ